MLPSLDIDPTDAVPIWRQIEDGMRRLIASGDIAPGRTVSSVRELARELRVNPATVSRAYRSLTADGVLLVRRGEGTFVAERPPAVMDLERKALLADGAWRFVQLAKKLRSPRAETESAVRAAWTESGGSE